MNRRHPRVLLVEGDDDRRVIPHFIEANGIRWGERNEPKLVHIESYDGIENLLRPGEIETVLKGSEYTHLGILVDANDSATRRWNLIRARCLGAFPELPDELPAEGLIVENERRRKLGIWLMPDKCSRGMLETFLAVLRPGGNEPLWQHTRLAFEEACRLGAGCKHKHGDKALIHTWLAWQDPPGLQLHQAVLARVLDPCSTHAGPFLRWFRMLHEL